MATQTQQDSRIARRDDGEGELRGNGPEQGFAITIAQMRMRMAKLEQAKRDVLDERTDYMTIPGTQKPSLLKPGAEKLLFLFNIRPEFSVVQSTRDFQAGFFEYLIRCDGYDRLTGALVGSGLGSANLYEKRYTRIQGPPCKGCSKPLKKGGRNWYCPQQDGGCGRGFGFDEVPANSGTRVENDDRFELDNTLLKMSQKRALLAMTLVATAASGMFTQDVEDLPNYIEGQPKPQTEQQPAPGSPPQRQRPQEAAQAGEWKRPASAQPLPNEASSGRKAYIALMTVAQLRGVKGINPLPDNATPGGIRASVQTAEKKLGMTWEQAWEEVNGAGMAQPGATPRSAETADERMNREQAEREYAAAKAVDDAPDDDEPDEDEDIALGVEQAHAARKKALDEVPF